MSDATSDPNWRSKLQYKGDPILPAWLYRRRDFGPVPSGGAEVLYLDGFREIRRHELNGASGRGAA